METAEHPIPAETEPTPDAVTPARQADARKLFKYSDYVHVGEGAWECEHATDGQCADIEHFHAWCRLPNPIQQENVRKKGLAAKARTIRMFNDQSTDSWVVLEQQLSAIDDPLFVEMIVDELLARDWPDDYMEAQADVEAEEEFLHIAEDREEYNRLGGADVSEDERSDAHKELATHIAAYIERLQARLTEIQQPKRDDLKGREVSAIVELVRQKRIEEESSKAFIDCYNQWTWFVGTFRVERHATLGRPHVAMWDEIGTSEKAAPGTMLGESPEVIAALRETYNELQLAFQKASSGN